MKHVVGKASQVRMQISIFPSWDERVTENVKLAQTGQVILKYTSPTLQGFKYGANSVCNISYAECVERLARGERRGIRQMIGKNFEGSLESTNCAMYRADW